LFLESIRRALKRVALRIFPKRLVRVYVYELVVYGVVLPYKEDTRKSMRKVYDERTLLQWECKFDEFVTLISDHTEVEERYQWECKFDEFVTLISDHTEVEERYWDDIVNDLLPKLQLHMVENKMTTYQDAIRADLLLKLPLGRFFKQWVREQIAKGNLLVKVQGVGTLSIRGVSATPKEIVEVDYNEAKKRINATGGRVVDYYEFSLIRPDEIEPYASYRGEWEHDIS